MILKKCVNGTEEDCSKWDAGDITSLLEKEELLEEIVWNGLKMWHLIFLSIAAVISVIILLCCCVKFRIPRTKQEIEADYIRRRILRKFRKRLKAIQNQELDEMDLKKALDKIRAEFKSDTESLAQSDGGLSGATISSLPGAGVQASTYRRASQIQLDISLEDLKAHTLGFRARVALAMSRLFGRSRVSQISQSDKVALTVAADGQAQLTVPEEGLTKKKSKPEVKKKDDIVIKVGDKVNLNPEATSSTAPGQSTSVKGQDKKANEEKKKVEKEKEKAEKARLKVENEKVKKEKKKIDKGEEQPGGSKSRTEDPKDKKAKDKKDNPKDKPDKSQEESKKAQEKADKLKEKLEKSKEKAKEKLEKSKEKPEKLKEKADKSKEKK